MYKASKIRAALVEGSLGDSVRFSLSDHVSGLFMGPSEQNLKTAGLTALHTTAVGRLCDGGLSGLRLSAAASVTRRRYVTALLVPAPLFVPGWL